MLEIELITIALQLYQDHPTSHYYNQYDSIMAVAVDKKHHHVDFQVCVLVILLSEDFHQIVDYSKDLITTEINLRFK
jgi:hypothetical protein